MGNTMPKRLDMKTVGYLKRDTHLSRQQIKDLYKTFRRISGGEWVITKEQFYQGLREAGVYQTGQNADWKFLESFFDSLDSMRNGTINFREFTAGISVFATGNLEDTLKSIFEMYNLAGDDKITEEEMAEAISSMGKCVELEHLSGSQNDSGWLDDTKAWVHQVFVEADESKTGTLSYTEFHRAVENHPVLQELASQFVQEVCRDFFAHSD
eukprot:TRINITY_DN60787_c0_g1_i1.p2 TRINITY_DN60787_c0_g1~~TRINITY_DN60787_c0_g1_i1.p2  ORF type:complete len:211 (+),score=89.72 TRINITY_DN60787_c0_g1_i1:88-720(+)